MPTKLNSAGKQQNYVPAGNGDASGEYGDNETGSNKHFQSFKKPSRTSELSKKQIKEIGQYVNTKKYETKDIIGDLRFYSGSFGDLSNFSDEELENIVDDLRNAKISDIPYYIKEGGKWKLTKNIGLLEKAGIPYYTKEQKDALDKEENKKLVVKSQTEQDKDIQKVLGKNSIVCFGKGYSKENLEQIKKDTESYINDFPELKDTITAMGDRNNLEKYLNALRENTEPSEEEIQSKIKYLKKYSIYDYTDEEYRKKAIENLKSPIKISTLRNAYAYWDESTKQMVYMAKMKNITDEKKETEYKSNFKSSNKSNATFCHELGHAVNTALKDYVKKKIDDLEKQLPSYGDGITSNEEIMRIRNEINPKITKLEKLSDDFKYKILSLRDKNYNKDYNNIFEKDFKDYYGVYSNDMNLDSNWRLKSQYIEDTENRLFEKGIKKYNISKYGASNKDEFIAECFSAFYTGMNNPLANEVVNEFKNYAKAIRGV